MHRGILRGSRAPAQQCIVLLLHQDLDVCLDVYLYPACSDFCDGFCVLLGFDLASLGAAGLQGTSSSSAALPDEDWQRRTAVGEEMPPKHERWLHSASLPTIYEDIVQDTHMRMLKAKARTHRYWCCNTQLLISIIR